MTEDVYSLSDAVAYADAMAGRRPVASVIAERLRGLEPSSSLKGITRFPWNSIFSVNFDDLIEKAYGATPDTRAAELEIYDPASGFERQSADRVPLYMLHGSYKRPLDPGLGLILTPDDIRKASARLQALYRRLTDDLKDKEIIYAGFSMSDSDFQQVISDIWLAVDGKDNLIPRGYAIQPGFRAFAQKHWDTKKISLIDATLEDFVAALHRLADGKSGVQPIPIGSVAFLPQFLSAINPASQEAEEISRAFDFPELDGGSADTALFFRGGPANWATIRERFDANRDITDSVLSRLLIAEPDEPVSRNPKATRFIFIDGPGGTGKTTLMMRIAWELSQHWSHPVVWAKTPAFVHFDLVEQLSHVAKRRLYVFIDNCADSGLQIVDVVRRCRARGLPVSFIASDRRNEWVASTKSNPLEADYRFDLDVITHSEAKEILGKLTLANELGTLKELTADEQLGRLMERPGGI